MKTKPRNAFYAQSGGVTAVINASACGVIETARRLYEFYGPVDFVRLGLRYAGAKLADRVNRLRPLTRPYSARDVAKRPMEDDDALPAGMTVLADEGRRAVGAGLASQVRFRVREHELGGR